MSYWQMELGVESCWSKDTKLQLDRKARFKGRSYDYIL